MLFIMQLPEYNQALQKGREVRNRLNQLYPKETELDQEHYRRALRLPNTSHPDVVRIHARTHTHSLSRASGERISVKFVPKSVPLFFFQPVGDESQARVVELVGQKPGDLM